LKRILCILLLLLLVGSLVGCMAYEGGSDQPVDISIVTRADPRTTDAATEGPTEPGLTVKDSDTEAPTEPGLAVTEDGVYDSKEEVALYIHLYGHLPSNYITKKDAEALGWPGGSLEPYAPGKCIGGSYFGNYEEKLPKAKGRTWTECDIDTLGAEKRGAKRIIFSNDGLIYYTDDHYETFELLYGEED
jgi:hypothetical protein